MRSRTSSGRYEYTSRSLVKKWCGHQKLTFFSQNIRSSVFRQTPTTFSINSVYSVFCGRCHYGAFASTAHSLAEMARCRKAARHFPLPRSNTWLPPSAHFHKELPPETFPQCPGDLKAAGYQPSRLHSIIYKRLPPCHALPRHWILDKPQYSHASWLCCDYLADHIIRHHGCA